MPYEPHRNVVREHLFDEQLSALIRDGEDADEFTAAAETVLARDPFYGSPVAAGSAVWQLPMPPIDARSVSIFYTFDEQTVTLLAIIAF